MFQPPLIKKSIKVPTNLTNNLNTSHFKKKSFNCPCNHALNVSTGLNDAFFKFTCRYYYYYKRVCYMIFCKSAEARPLSAEPRRCGGTERRRASRLRTDRRDKALVQRLLAEEEPLALCLSVPGTAVWNGLSEMNIST